MKNLSARSKLTAALLVISVAFLAYDVFCAVRWSSDFPAITLTYIVDGLTCLCAIFYCLAGYKKQASVLFRSFCILQAVSAVFLLVTLCTVGTGSILWILSVIVICLVLLCRLVFAFVPNLGRKAAFTLFYGMVILLLVSAILTALSYPYGLTGYVSVFALTIVFFIMLIGKYDGKRLCRPV